MINFLKYRKIYFLFSAIVIGAGLFAILQGGLRPSIEFTGGTSVEYEIDKKADLNKVKEVYKKNNIETEELSFEGNVLRVRSKPQDTAQETRIKQEIEKSTGAKITVLKSETVGPILGQELIRKTIIAALLGVFVILGYVTYAFKNFRFALAAIGALFHDILVVIGMYAVLGLILGAEVDTLFVTALLTTMSFSVHDTIVIFDKIREYKRERGFSNVEEVANQALAETMVRSLNNSMTIVFMLLALVLLGGSTIKFFVLALLIGTITGTYSSPFIATPLLILLETRSTRKTR